MAFFPGYSSISPIFCPFCSPSLCFRFLSQEQRPVLRDFPASDQDKLFSNLIAQFVGKAPATQRAVRSDLAQFCLWWRSEEHTSELQSHLNLVCRLLLEKKKTTITEQVISYATQYYSQTV